MEVVFFSSSEQRNATHDHDGRVCDPVAVVGAAAGDGHVGGQEAVRGVAVLVVRVHVRAAQRLEDGGRHGRQHQVRQVEEVVQVPAVGEGCGVWEERIMSRQVLE